MDLVAAFNFCWADHEKDSQTSGKESARFLSLFFYSRRRSTLCVSPWLTKGAIGEGCTTKVHLAKFVLRRIRRREFEVLVCFDETLDSLSLVQVFPKASGQLRSDCQLTPAPASLSAQFVNCCGNIFTNQKSLDFFTEERTYVGIILPMHTLSGTRSTTWKPKQALSNPRIIDQLLKNVTNASERQVQSLDAD